MYSLHLLNIRAYKLAGAPLLHFSPPPQWVGYEQVIDSVCLHELKQDNRVLLQSGASQFFFRPSGSVRVLPFSMSGFWVHCGPTRSVRKRGGICLSCMQLSPVWSPAFHIVPQALPKVSTKLGVTPEFCPKQTGKKKKKQLTTSGQGVEISSLNESRSLRMRNGLMKWLSAQEGLGPTLPRISWVC